MKVFESRHVHRVSRQPAPNTHLRLSQPEPQVTCTDTHLHSNHRPRSTDITCPLDGIAVPQDLMDVVWCGCKEEGKACGTESCSCHHGKISCTVYCACACSENCFNPFKREEDEDEVENGRVDMEDGDEDIRGPNDIDLDPYGVTLNPNHSEKFNN